MTTVLSNADSSVARLHTLRTAVGQMLETRRIPAEIVVGVQEFFDSSTLTSGSSNSDASRNFAKAS